MPLSWRLDWAWSGWGCQWAGWVGGVAVGNLGGGNVGGLDLGAAPATHFKSTYSFPSQFIYLNFPFLFEAERTHRGYRFFWIGKCFGGVDRLRSRWHWYSTAAANIAHSSEPTDFSLAAQSSCLVLEISGCWTRWWWRCCYRIPSTTEAAYLSGLLLAHPDCPCFVQLSWLHVASLIEVCWLVCSGHLTCQWICLRRFCFYLFCWWVYFGLVGMPISPPCSNLNCWGDFLSCLRHLCRRARRRRHLVRVRGIWSWSCAGWFARRARVGSCCRLRRRWLNYSPTYSSKASSFLISWPSSP